MIKYTNAAMSKLYDTRDEVIQGNILEVLEHFNSLFVHDHIDVQKDKIKRLTDACDGAGLYEVTIVEITPTGKRKPIRVKEGKDTINPNDISTTISDWGGIPAESEKPITDINVGQEIDVEVDKGDSILTKKLAVSKFNVGDEVIILSVDRTAFTSDTIGKKGIVIGSSALIHVKVGDKVQFFTPDQLEKVVSNVESKFNVGDRVVLINLDNTTASSTTLGKEYTITNMDVKGICPIKIIDMAGRVEYVNPYNIRKIILNVGDRVEVINVDNTPYDTENYKGIKGTIINIGIASRPIAIKVGDAEYYFRAYNLKKL